MTRKHLGKATTDDNSSGVGVNANSTSQSGGRYGGPDTLPGNLDDDFTLKTASPAIDHGVDPRTFGFPFADALVTADYLGEGRRPFDGDHNQQAAFDGGALESHNNHIPVADAGPDQTVHVGDTVQLNGSGSTGMATRCASSGRFWQNQRGVRQRCLLGVLPNPCPLLWPTAQARTKCNWRCLMAWTGACPTSCAFPP